MLVLPAHYRVTALGYLGATPSGEHFSYGFNMRHDSGEDSNARYEAGLAGNDAYWADVAADVVAFHQSAAAKMSTAVWLHTVKIAAIGPTVVDGVLKPAYLRDPRTIATGVGGGVAHSTYILPQSALAVSFNTLRRGASGRGRFFLPMPVLAADNANGFRVSVADAESVRGAVAGLLGNVNNAPGFDLTAPTVHVVSTKGFSTQVEGVRVGRIIDTIRTRRRQLGESYTAEADVSGA